jgi:uncharacterized protein (TIGR02598 family)
MNQRDFVSSSFSLVEVTIALGVASFCLIAVFGLLPVGLQTNRNALGRTAATSILSSVTADLRATPPASSTTPQYGIMFGTETTVYIDGEGRFTSAIDVRSRYRLTVTFPPSPTGSFQSTFANLKITWPAALGAVNPNGSIEIFAAFNRR